MNPSREESTVVRPILSLGRYAVFGELASGGMATVHFGRMSSLGGFNRTVAIKRMRNDIARDPEFVAMFLDEARLTSRIEHPNVVATLDVVAEAGEVFLVMEYVRGESLQRLRRAAHSRREKIPAGIAVSIVGGALAGLHAAHNAMGEDGVPLGIIHRDVSPQNILVGEDGNARITDFGIAKAESRLQITHDGQMKGKLPYMAPEQLAGGGKRLDRRVDIFSAAVVLWELLAAKGLFRADHPGEMIAKVLSAPIPSLTALRPDVPAALDRAIRKALSRNPDQRPPTAEAFALEIEEGLGPGLASPRMVGAWVASLAGEVLANRLKYVREMESTSWSVRLADGASAASAAGLLAAVAEAPEEIILDPEPDLSSYPSGPRRDGLDAPPGAAVQTAPALAPPPPHAVAQQDASALAPEGWLGGVGEGQLAPAALVGGDVAAAPSSPFGSPPTGEPVGPMSALVSASPTEPSPSASYKRVPMLIVGSVLGLVALVLIVAAAVGAALIKGESPPAESATAPGPPAQLDTPPSKATTAAPVEPAEPLESAAPAVATQSSSPPATAPSATDTKGGSSGVGKTRPPYIPPVATGKGTKPYLPDMP